MKTAFLLIIIVSFYSCKEKPNYNPFDDQFNVSVNQLIKDKCDTIPAGCGYFNLTKEQGKLNIYYQVFIEDFHTVLAKGFAYQIDTFNLQVDDFQTQYLFYIDSLTNLSFNYETLNESLNKYEYSFINRHKDSISIASLTKEDTITLEINTYLINDNHAVVRNISYYNFDPDNPDY